MHFHSVFFVLKGVVNVSTRRQLTSRNIFEEIGDLSRRKIGLLTASDYLLATLPNHSDETIGLRDRYGADYGSNTFGAHKNYS